MNRIYPGVDEDLKQGITPTGNIIRDAWVFGILPESETCTGWTLQGIESLYDRVSAAWEPHGHQVSRLPPELFERHQRIYRVAVERARENGWDPSLGEDD
jgi:hypothetical protein